jgi:hypothetical protein
MNNEVITYGSRDYFVLELMASMHKRYKKLKAKVFKPDEDLENFRYEVLTKISENINRVLQAHNK